MICPACHTANIEGADVCSNCGQALYGLDLPDAPQGSQSPDFIQQSLASLPKREPAKVGISDPVYLAVRMMQTQETGCVLVMDGQRLAGIITGWDILNKVADPTKDLNAVTCGQVMTADPASLHDEDSVALTLNLMASGGFRHIPILRAGQPAGVIDVIAIFRHLSPHLV
jgi:CBS domain-containing protein